MVVSIMAVSIRFNPRRAVTDSFSRTTSEYWISHHYCFTNNVGGNVPSDTSQTNPTIFLSNQDGLEKCRLRLLIPHITCTCVLGFQTHTTSDGLYFRGILARVATITSANPWPYYFSRSKIWGKDAANGSICISPSTSVNVWVLKWLVPPSIGPVCCFGVTTSMVGICPGRFF